MEERSTAIIRILSNFKKLCFPAIIWMFQINFGPNNLYNFSSSLAHVLLDIATNTQPSKRAVGEPCFNFTEKLVKNIQDQEVSFL